MKRRQFGKTAILGAAGLIGGGAVWLGMDRAHEELTITSALAKLEVLSNKPLSNSGEWNPYQIFMHCAQSVEYSLTGFPEHKSALFKNTAGQLAFSVFSARGEMSHGLSEPIAGAPLFTAEQDVDSAINRLKQSLMDFESYQGDLAPHFVYGELSRQDYEIAHVIHLNNHLFEIQMLEA